MKKYFSFDKEASNDIKLVRFDNSEIIKEKGIYQLDDTSHFVLIPNYTSFEENSSLLKTLQGLEFSQKFHKNGSKEMRLTHYIGPQCTYGDITQKQNFSWHPDVLKVKAI